MHLTGGLAGLHIVKRTRIVGADCYLELFGFPPCGLSSSSRQDWFPSVAVSGQYFNRVSMEAVWPLNGKGPELAESHFCHILLDKTSRKLNQILRGRKVDSTCGSETCQCHVAKSCAYWNWKYLYPVNLSCPPPY